jgi:hypothetical protein
VDRTVVGHAQSFDRVDVGSQPESVQLIVGIDLLDEPAQLRIIAAGRDVQLDATLHPFRY